MSEEHAVPESPELEALHQRLADTFSAGIGSRAKNHRN